MDYLVRDEGSARHAIVDADQPVDAAQRYIKIAKKEFPQEEVDPYDLSIFPIVQKNRILRDVGIEPNEE